MIIQNHERPYVVFEVVENPGQIRDQFREKDNGKKILVSRKATLKHVAVKLTDSVSNSPYPWVRADWLAEEIEKGKRVVSIHGIENLPVNYSPEWKKTLVEFAKNVNNHAGKDSVIAKLRAENEALRKQNAQTIEGGENVKTGLSGAQGRSGEIGTQTGESLQPAQARGQNRQGAK